MNSGQVPASEVVAIVASNLQELPKELCQLRELLVSLEGGITNQEAEFIDAVRNLRVILDDITSESHKMSVDCASASKHMLTRLVEIEHLNPDSARNSLQNDIIYFQQRPMNCKIEIRTLNDRAVPFMDVIDRKQMELSKLTPEERPTQPKRQARHLFHRPRNSSGQVSKVPFQAKTLKNVAKDYDGVLGGLRVFEDFYVQLLEEITKLEGLLANADLQAQDTTAVATWLRGMSNVFSEYRDLVA